MPTDGADFGRTRPCYGKAFTMARDGADEADVAETIGKGVELDIRRDGGAPAFRIAVDILMAASNGRGVSELVSDVDGMRKAFADSPLTRHLANATDTIAQNARMAGRILSQQQAAEALIAQIGISRCCDGMTGYVARNRTKNFVTAQRVVDGFKQALPQTMAVRDLAIRMLNCSLKGLPARPPRAARVNHSVEGLGEEL